VTATFFASAAAFAAWLERHGGEAEELWVGFYKKGSGKPGISYPEALDAALCCGWIDGVRKGIDEKRYAIRFTPRKAKSIWSAVNIRRAGKLTRAGKMKPAGAAALARRQSGPAPYSFESRPRTLDSACARVLRASPRAVKFLEAQPPSYQRVVTFWVMSAKQEETRARRLQTLIASSEQGLWVPPMRWASNAPGKRAAAPARRRGSARYK
jgi:uncharacterized protein YdeI (YjbR/CyaY-like superfamily)